MQTQDIILEDNQLICILTENIKKASSQEKNIQSIIRMLNEEYGFDMADLARDFNITFVDPDTGKNKKQKLEVVVFEKETDHTQDNIIRIAVVQDEKIKENDKKKGVTPTLENAVAAVENCEFGLWTNGQDIKYLQREYDVFDNENFIDLADFPGQGETIEDIDRADRSHARKPANDSLIKVFKRSHDYIYGNEGRKKDAFWQLLYLIFCKLYDEKRRFLAYESGESYRRKFWVGVKEQNTEDGRKQVAERIKKIFEELKKSQTFSDVFDGNEAIDLTDKGVAFIAGELAKYNFLDATVDVKGMAYETIVSNTLKQEAGQFFTPRNIVKAMVEMLDPNENTRVLDPACGSGGFLVMVLDHVRKKIAKDLYPELDGVLLADKFNTYEVNERVREYAETNIFGFDFDPDLKKAARMNMVMAGDGHANIFHVNSLAYPQWEHPEEIAKIKSAIDTSVERMQDIIENYTSDARGKFDMIFTNPPFGAKVKVDTEIAEKYFLSKYSDAPEVLFIEACYNLLKPGGKMAIVLPDGILGNPNTLPVREWILENFKILASVDLAVEAFLPQVGVQASLLFLEKKTDLQRNIANEGSEDYDVFMAIAEKLGKDRRGNPIYVRDEDGAEILFPTTTEYVVKDKEENAIVKARTEKLRKLDDNLPMIVEAYYEFLNK
ncbi:MULTISPECIES: methylation-associated defense system DNA methyltransferase MAD2 [Myroides]|uniref:N-6 DNA methylase n=1 Tax=Myroides odoratimimus TaxID=76832 RepID=A0AAI8C759_9FLAO|nr:MULTISPECIES: N-6 DNA methylase [Myroides]ALU27413.1 N-6 DNA methylase [Myroides odoratimimus]MCC9041185.1 SAM-dependent methyltransferase [Myroides oncorhynchi]MCS7474949.1 SAM-dependent methyltransferase [Myroides odoratimimus]MDM1460792.1 N-6 DNA methylase [Myroides odoratimimus]